MKNLTLSITICLAVLTTALFSQNCSNFYPLNANTGYEMQNFKANGKLTGTTKTTITSVKSEVKGATANMTGESFDEKGKAEGKVEYAVICTGTQILINMKSLMSAQTMEAYKDMQVTFTSTDMEVPNELTVGLALKDASAQMSISNNGMAFSDMTFNYVNRKVLSKESLTIPLGTFECYKITYDVNMVSKTMGMPMKKNFKIVEYLAKDKGTIKSETYGENGKLDSYSVMSKVF